MAGGYSQQGYHQPQAPMSWGPPGPTPMQQPGYGYMQPGAYPGQPSQYNMSQPPYAGYPPPTSSGFSSGWDQSSNPPTQQTTPGSGYDYYNQQQQPQQQQPLGGSAAPAENATYNYGEPPRYSSQASYGSTVYSQTAVGQQQGYGSDNYSGGYQAPASHQPGYSQPQSNTPAGYDHQQGYGSTPTYAAPANPSQDGSASTYGAQGGPTQVPSSQQAPPVQPTGPQQGYTSQPLSTASPAYPTQGTAQPGYGVAPTSQSAYGSQPPAQSGYGQSVQFPQPGYGQSPQSQKPPTQPVYGQAQQPQTTQAGYIQPASVQPGYSHGQLPPAQSAYGSVGPQPGYGQQQVYGSVPPPGQPGYVQQQQQQQQQYTDSYGGSVGGYSEQSGDAHGSYDAPAVIQAVPSGVAKASPQS